MDKILIVEDDNVARKQLASALGNYKLITANTGKQAIASCAETCPDLIIMDIVLPDTDGYEVTRILRSVPDTAQVPVIFLSSLNTLDDRLKAYGAGGTDYMTKPFERRELLAKIINLLSIEHEKAQLSHELHKSYSVIMNLQQASAQAHVISRFVQEGQYCHNLATLTDLFLRTTRGLNTRLVVQVRHADEDIMRSDNGHINDLEKEILEMSSELGKVYLFGKNRAIYNWPHVSVLIRNFEDINDNIAVLLDAFESGISTVSNENRLIQEVRHIEDNNNIVKDSISDLRGEMGQDLKKTFVSMGLVSELSQDEEDVLMDYVKKYNDKIIQKLSQLSENNSMLIKLINEIRTPPAVMQKVLFNDDHAARNDNGICFF